VTDKIAQAIERLTAELKIHSRKMEALTEEIRQLRLSFDSFTRTPAEKRAAFETYLGGRPDAS